MRLVPLSVIELVCGLLWSQAFVTRTSSFHGNPKSHGMHSMVFRTYLNALTDRQMQFWEDVEEGLDNIEEFYKKRGENIDRLRQFGKRQV